MQNNIEIYVNKSKLDLGDSIDLNLSKSFEANSSIEFSYSFEIPATYNNQCILGFANKLHVLGKFQHTYYTELYANGILIIQGSLYIDSANNNTYSCNLISNKELATKDAINRVNINALTTTNSNGKKEDVYIDEIKLNFPDKDGKYYRWILKNPSLGGDWENCSLLNKENYPTQYADLNIVEDCLIYPYALYGKPVNYLTGQGSTPLDISNVQQVNNGRGFSDADNYGLAMINNAQQYMRPAFNVVDIVKTIFLNAGFTNFSGKFFTDPKFTELYQTFQGNEKTYYDRDNQKFAFQVTKHIEGLVNYKKESTGRYVVESTLRKIDSDIFEWKPKDYDEFEDSRAIRFLCTKLFQPADLTVANKNVITTAMEYNGTDWNNPMLKNTDLTKTANSFNEILIKKAGWYLIQTNFSYEYKAGTDTLMTYKGLDANYQDTITNNYQTASGSKDVINFANNVWEFQIVKHKSDPTLYSEILGRSNQKYLKNSPYLVPEDVSNGVNGKSVYITTRFNSVKEPLNSNNDHFADSIRIPKNNQTLFVDDEDFVCGFRVGNQGYYDYSGRTPVNRHRMGMLLNLPYIDAYYHNGSLQDLQYIENEKYLKLWRTGLNTKVTVENAGVIGTHDYYGPMEKTMINMVRSENSYTANNENFKPIGINNYNYDKTVVTYNDFPYQDELGSRFWLYDNYCDNRYSQNPNLKNIDSGFKVESKNLVWLDEGEYDARFISPVITTNPRNPEDEDYNELDGTDHPLAAKRIDYDIIFEYIGISDKEWKPTANDINQSVHSDKWTYFNQYLPHEKAIDWLENLQKTFNLEFKFNSDSNEVIGEFNDKNSFTNSVDITPYVDFGSLSSGTSTSFKEGGQPSSITLKMKNDEESYGSTSDAGSFSIYLGGTNDPEVVETNYSYSTMENIGVGSFEVPRLIIPTPVICTETVWNANYPYTQTYEYSGSDKAKLFYKGKVWNNGTFRDTFNWVINWDVARYIKFPVLSPTSSDGTINLQSPSTFMSSLWNFNSGSGSSGSGNEYVEILAYLPLLVYNNIGKNTVIKLDDSYFRIDSIDNYNIIDTSCKIKLNLIN